MFWWILLGIWGLGMIWWILLGIWGLGMIWFIFELITAPEMEDHC
ncbi:TPA: hypothetical protein ACGM4B_000769 [Streptococcus agalactiae]|nr:MULTISPECIES: hypothetical protein [Streptococcus]EPW75301.1 hypothetical protein SAG0101_09960 [Streptococcus agalactiae BSU451]CZT39571.1 hypothetical protein SA111_01460 [Streptococcus agalactiae]